MTAWRKLYCQLKSSSDLTEEEITDFIHSKNSKIKITVAQDRVIMQISERNTSYFDQFLREYGSEFTTVAIGFANDTGPGPDRVVFYDITEDGESVEAKKEDCPTRYKKLNIEHVH